MTIRSKAKIERRAQLIEENEALLNEATTANEGNGREFTEEEQRTWDSNEQEVENLDKEIERLQKHEKRMAEKEARAQKDKRRNGKEGGEPGEVEKIAKRYSVVKAIRSKVNRDNLEGVELEMHQEAEKEYRESGIIPQAGGIMIPSRLMQKDAEKRAVMQVGNQATGGVAVDTELQGIIPYLYPEMQVRNLGARVVTGLVGNIDVVRKTGTTTASWVGELDQSPETNPTYENLSLSPKRLTSYVPISRQLLMQDSLDLEQDLRTDMSLETSLAVDRAAISGGGTGNVPEGILSTSGIGSVAIDTNGGSITRTHLVKLINELTSNNAAMGTMGFLTTPGVKSKLMDTKLDSGSGRFIWESNDSLMGYRALTSTNMPSNLTKGTGTDLHSMIFANWADWWIGQWGGTTLIIDEVTLARENQIRLVMHTYWDMYMRHLKSFAAIKDIDATLS